MKRNLSELISYINFVYDNIEACWDKEEFIGLRVKKEGKYGFLRHKGNPFNLMYMGCHYDYLVPIVNKSSFHNGVLRHYSIFFTVEQEGKWGIEIPNVYDMETRWSIKCQYDSISIVDDYPAFAIVCKGNKFTFLDINHRTEFSKYYQEIFPVRSKNGSQSLGLFFACIKQWDNSLSFPAVGYYPYSSSDADIFDITQNAVVDQDKFESLHYPLSKKEGIRWIEK